MSAYKNPKNTGGTGGGATGATGAKGDKGDTGLTGDVGATGVTGATGATGAVGATGATGVIGNTGAAGAQGTIGATGATGATGAIGATGLQGATGNTGATGTNGTNGKSFNARGAYSAGNTYAQYDLSTLSGSSYYWVTVTSGNTSPPSVDWQLVATQGAAGIQGTQGATGATGATGTQGIQGATGVTGTQGATGIQGATGNTGANGTNGTSFTNVMTALGDSIIGGASGAATRLPIGTTNQVLTVVSGSPAWAVATGGFSNPMTASGDTIYGGASGVATRLAAGTDGSILKLVGGVPAWGFNADFSNTFCDVFFNGTASMGAFSIVTINQIISNPGNCFNNSTYLYTVPSTGTYQITGTFRVADSSPANVNFGVGVHSSSIDGSWFYWSTTSNATTATKRLTVPYIRVAAFTAGQQLRMFCYFDSTALNYASAGLQIIRIA